MSKIKKYIEFINEGLGTTIPLPNDIIEISNAYINAGKDIYLVGGAVRDFIQGLQPKDWDLVTNALPHESKKILSDFKVSDEQGKNFGVLRVYTDDQPEGYEIASYRIDISGGRDTKGGGKKVEMGEGVTMIDDCMRRDLTINSLFYDIKNEKIVDLVGGVSDIKNRIIRAVGDPGSRFIEDRLRILRIFRFAARMGGVIDDKTGESIKSDNRLRGVGPQDDVSQERIWDEFKKAWKQSPDFNIYLNLITEYNMWEQIFPGVEINTELIRSNDFVVVVSNLFKFNPLDGLVKKLVIDYKIESNLANKIIFLIDFLEFQPQLVFKFYKRRKSCGVSDSTLREWLVHNGMSDNEYMNKFIDYIPSVNSRDLISSGFTGQKLGIEIERREVEKFKGDN